APASPGLASYSGRIGGTGVASRKIAPSVDLRYGARFLASRSVQSTDREGRPDAPRPQDDRRRARPGGGGFDERRRARRRGVRGPAHGAGAVGRDPRRPVPGDPPGDRAGAGHREAVPRRGPGAGPVVLPGREPPVPGL